MECPLLLLAFLARPRRCKSCALTTSFPEKCFVLPDPRAPNLRPGAVWLRRRTARLCEYRGGYASTRCRKHALTEKIFKKNRRKKMLS
uniref:Putative secreted protein n=1 Tax=Ixodes ricinus TaxID=34613 RepID=A0A6B0UBT6_IXORI